MLCCSPFSSAGIYVPNTVQNGGVLNLKCCKTHVRRTVYNGNVLTFYTAVKFILVEWELWQNSMLRVIPNNLKHELYMASILF
jgi:hypothetical protein